MDGAGHPVGLGDQRRAAGQGGEDAGLVGDLVDHAEVGADAPLGIWPDNNKILDEHGPEVTRPAPALSTPGPGTTRPTPTPAGAAVVAVSGVGGGLLVAGGDEADLAPDLGQPVGGVVELDAGDAEDVGDTLAASWRAIASPPVIVVSVHGSVVVMPAPRRRPRRRGRTGR